MNKNEIVAFWITSSDVNYKSMLNMFKSGEYMWALFIGHLVIEKLLKAYYVKTTGGDVPRTHDLLRLAVAAGMKIDETMKDNLQYITLFNIETRYEEYKREFHKKCNRRFARESIAKIKEIRKWLKEKLKKLVRELLKRYIAELDKRGFILMRHIFLVLMRRALPNNGAILTLRC